MTIVFSYNSISVILRSKNSVLYCISLVEHCVLMLMSLFTPVAIGGSNHFLTAFKGVYGLEKAAALLLRPNATHISAVCCTILENTEVSVQFYTRILGKAW